MMKFQQPVMRPQDVVVLLKILTYGDQTWRQTPMSEELHMSQSEISQSIARSQFAGLLDPTSKNVRRLTFIEFLQYGLGVVFPQHPGPVLRGIPTAHSAPPLNLLIKSSENYVWPSGTGKVRGHSIVPLYPSVVKAVQHDEKLYELLALIDALRVGRAREKKIAIQQLKIQIIDGE